MGYEFRILAEEILWAVIVIPHLATLLGLVENSLSYQPSSARQTDRTARAIYSRVIFLIAKSRHESMNNDRYGQAGPIPWMPADSRMIASQFNRGQGFLGKSAIAMYVNDRQSSWPSEPCGLKRKI